MCNQFSFPKPLMKYLFNVDIDARIARGVVIRDTSSNGSIPDVCNILEPGD